MYKKYQQQLVTKDKFLWNNINSKSRNTNSKENNNKGASDGDRRPGFWLGFPLRLRLWLTLRLRLWLRLSVRTISVTVLVKESVGELKAAKVDTVSPAPDRDPGEVGDLHVGRQVECQCLPGVAAEDGGALVVVLVVPFLQINIIIIV